MARSEAIHDEACSIGAPIVHQQDFIIREAALDYLQDRRYDGFYDRFLVESGNYKGNCDGCSVRTQARPIRILQEWLILQ